MCVLKEGPSKFVAESIVAFENKFWWFFQVFREHFVSNELPLSWALVGGHSMLFISKVTSNELVLAPCKPP